MVILQKLNKNTVRLLGLLLFIVTVVLLVSPLLTQAAQSPGPDDGSRDPIVTPTPTPTPGPDDGSRDPIVPSGGITEDQPIVTIGDGFLNGLYGFVIIFFGKLVVYGAGLFSYGITNFTIGFGDLYLDWGIGFAVEQSWATVRDLFNLTFIFGLIYIGFRMILFADDTQAKRTLITLVGAALLVNFSLFITKFVIDVANSLTGVIFTQGFSTIQADIGSAFLNLIGLSSVFNNGAQIIDITNAGTGAGLALIFGTMLFMATAAFVFAAGGILLIIRAIVLTFFLIFSPVMFLGWVFPGLAQYSKQYWKTFLGNVFMAPAYIFSIYISYRILDGFRRPLSADSNIAAAMTNDDSSVVVASIVFFTLAIVLLVASMKVAKSMGAFGAGAALSIGDNTRKYAQGSITSYAGRNTVGRLASGAGKINERMEGSRGGRLAKGLVSVGTLGVLDERTRQNITNAGKKAKFGGSYSREDDIKFAEDQMSTRSRVTSAAATKKILRDGTRAGASNDQVIAMQRAAAQVSPKDLEGMTQAERIAIAPYLTAATAQKFMESEKVNGGDLSAFQTRRTEAFRELVQHNGQVLTRDFGNLSIAQLEEVGAEFIEANAQHLTEDQLKGLRSSKKFVESQVANFDNLRRTRRTNEANNGNATSIVNHTYRDAAGAIQSELKSPAEIAAMPAAVVVTAETAASINSRVLQEIEKGTKFTQSQREQIAANILQNPTAANADARAYLANPKVIADGKWG